MSTMCVLRGILVNMIHLFDSINFMVAWITMLTRPRLVPRYIVWIATLSSKAEIDRYAIKKELKSDNGKIFYEELPSSYHHPDFLTGTTAKTLRYKEPLLYKKLFEHFEKNLHHAEKLIIIGYGGRDVEVNRIVLEHFDHQSKPSYIIDPYAGEEIRELGEKLGATLLPPEKTVETVTIQDLQ